MIGDLIEAIVVTMVLLLLFGAWLAHVSYWGLRIAWRVVEIVVYASVALLAALVGVLIYVGRGIGEQKRRRAEHQRE